MSRTDRRPDSSSFVAGRFGDVSRRGLLLGSTAALGLVGCGVGSHARRSEPDPTGTHSETSTVAQDEAPWVPDLIGPPASGHPGADGNVLHRVHSLPHGGPCATWVASDGRTLDLVRGTSTSDAVRLRVPSEPNLVADLEEFSGGRLQHEVRTWFGDSVLLQVLHIVVADPSA